jgi:hypothetical protein
VCLESLGASVEQAKLRAFSRASHPVQKADFPYGPCNACGTRPAQRPEPDNRCPVCEQEHELGGELPRIEAFCWRPAPDGRIRSSASWLWTGASNLHALTPTGSPPSVSSAATP